jgi:hypothetical protein
MPDDLRARGVKFHFVCLERDSVQQMNAIAFQPDGFEPFGRRAGTDSASTALAEAGGIGWGGKLR